MNKRIIFSFLMLLGLIITLSGCSKTKSTKSCAMVFEERVGSVSTNNIDAVKAYFQIEEVLSLRTDLRVIDRSRVETAMEEQAFQQSDWSDNSKTAEIGKALNADYIVFIVIYEQFYGIEFMDVNTFQKTTFRGEITSKGELGNLNKLRKIKVNESGDDK